MVAPKALKFVLLLLYCYYPAAKPGIAVSFPMTFCLLELPLFGVLDEVQWEATGSHDYPTTNLTLSL